MLVQNREKQRVDLLNFVGRVDHPAPTIRLEPSADIRTAQRCGHHPSSVPTPVVEIQVVRGETCLGRREAGLLKRGFLCSESRVEQGVVRGRRVCD